MNQFLKILASLFGGIFIGNQSRLSIIIRFVIYFIILVFFEIFFYIDFNGEANSNENDDNCTIHLIAAGALTFCIFMIKLILWILNTVVKSVDESSDSMDSKIENRPDDIPPDIWQLRDTIIKSKDSQDLVIADLLASGVDSAGLMNLVNYIQRNDQISELSISKSDDNSGYVINICGKLFYTKLSPNSFGKIFPSNSSFFVVLMSALLCFISTYFSFSIKSYLLSREKWWIAIVCSICIYSILYPVDSDPYSTRILDQWTGCSRPFALFVITGLWLLVIHLDDLYFIQNNHNKQPRFVISFLYNVSIKWELISPYLNDIFRYGLIFLPILVFTGMISHPISFLISIIESFNRYFFGQNGVSNIVHLFIQVIRGAASVAISWALLNYKFSGLTLAASITISTFLGTFPILYNFKKSSLKLIFFSYPFLLSSLSFLLSFCLVDLAGNRWDIISWISFGWILIVDVLFPYFSSNERYFLLHFRLFHSFCGSILIRNLTQLIVTPLFISSVLHSTNKYIHNVSDSYDDIGITKGNEVIKQIFTPQIQENFSSNSLPKLVVAFAIVHGIQKANTEPHIFFVAVCLTVLTLPYEFDLQFPAVNFIISLLISAKLEIFIPQVKLALTSRNASFLFKNDENKQGFLFSFFIQLFTKIFQMIPMADLLFKVPSLIWSFITGASFISIKGIPFLLISSPIRPTYFFDFPVCDDQELESIFSKKEGDISIEAPVYASVSKSLESKLATIIRSGRLGFVNSGDIFLFQESTSLLTVLVHIIVIEPYCIKMKIRGLEYTDRTLCHAEEDLFLLELINGYHRFPNFFASAVASCATYDIRALGIPLKVYESSKTNVQEAFLGIEPSFNIKILVVSYCHVFKALSSLSNINVQEDIQQLPTDIAESEIVQLFHSQQNFEIINDLLKESCSLNDDEIGLLFGLFVMVCTSILDESGNFIVGKNDTDPNVPSTLNVVDFFNGRVIFRDEFQWIYNYPIIFDDFILPTIRIGVVASFLASSGLLDDTQNIEEISDFIDEVCETYIITTINSPIYRSTFLGVENSQDSSSTSSPQISSHSSKSSENEIDKNENINKFDKRKKIIILDKINNEDVIIRFSRNKVKWDVLKINHEWIRALWANDVMDILFYGNTESERMSIQYNKLFLNNMILQACDSPIGYPAYVSKVVESLVHPGSIKKFST